MKRFTILKTNIENKKNERAPPENFHNGISFKGRLVNKQSKMRARQKFCKGENSCFNVMGKPKITLNC